MNAKDIQEATKRLLRCLKAYFIGSSSLQEAISQDDLIRQFLENYFVSSSFHEDFGDDELAKERTIKKTLQDKFASCSAEIIKVTKDPQIIQNCSGYLKELSEKKEFVLIAWKAMGFDPKKLTPS